MTDPSVGLFARYSDRLDRWVQFGVAGGRVIKVDFVVERPPEAVDDHQLLDRFARYLDDGEPIAFDDVEIALTGPTAYRPVYETLRELPYGTAVSVADIVDRTAQLAAEDDPERTVREALGANPVPVIVPDHRVSDATGAVARDIRASLRDLEGLT